MYINNSAHINGQVKTAQVWGTADTSDSQRMYDADSLQSDISAWVVENTYSHATVYAAREVIRYLVKFFTSNYMLSEIERYLDDEAWAETGIQVQLEYEVRGTGHGYISDTHHNVLLLRGGNR